MNDLRFNNTVSITLPKDLLSRNFQLKKTFYFHYAKCLRGIPEKISECLTLTNERFAVQLKKTLNPFFNKQPSFTIKRKFGLDFHFVHVTWEMNERRSMDQSEKPFGT